MKSINSVATKGTKLAILATLVFVFGYRSFAGNEKMSSRITGSQIQVNNLLAVTDSKYPGVTLSGTALVRNSFAKVSLGLDKYAQTLNYFGMSNFYLKVGVEINYYDAAGSMTTINRDLVIDYSSTGVSADRSYVVIKNVHATVVKVLYMNDIAGNPATFVPSNLFLEAEIETDRVYDMNLIQPPVVNHYYYSTSNELEVYWNTVMGAEEYELEYTFVNSIDVASNSTPYNYETSANAVVGTLANSAMAFSFNNNATRIRTKGNSFRISMTYPQGVLAYRVRAIGRSTSSLANSELEVFTVWSYDQPQTTLTIPVSTYVSAVDDYTVIGGSIPAHEQNKNWQIATTFAEDGKKKEVISYFDGSNRKRQVVTRSNSESVSLIGESIYDSQGRVAITVLPAPSPVSSTDYSSELKYFENFNQSSNQTPVSGIHVPYSRVDFETSGGSCPVPAGGMYAGAYPSTGSNGASLYYSQNNINKENQNAYIPDAELYPFSHNTYNPDPEGKILYQSGVGADLKVGSGHTTKYLTEDAAQSDLDKLFGSEAGYAEKYKKTKVVDPNGQMSVSYLNTEGKTVATALAGNPPANLDQLGSYGVYSKTSSYMDYHDGNYTSVNVGANGAITFKTKIVPDVTGTYNFFYDITAPQFNDACISSFCYDCIYDLSITLTNECNQVEYSLQQPVGSIGSLDFTCGTPVYFTSTGITPAFAKTLNAGTSYVLTKVLTINKSAMDQYTQHYTDTTKNTCLQKLSQLTSLEIANTDFSGCGMTCQTCSLKVEAYYLNHNVAANADPSNPSYDPNYIYMSPAQKKLAIDQCMKPCRPASLCQTEFETMLMDVKPQGQYAQYKILQSGTYDAGTYELSLFNDVNYLPISCYFGSSMSGQGTNFVSFDITKKSHWRNPEYYNRDQHSFTALGPDGVSSKDHYFNADGSISKIRLVQTATGFYPITVVSTISTNTTIAGVYQDNIGYWTYPENLFDVKDFIDAYSNNSHWALSLVKNHPEFIYFLDCDRQSNPTYGIAGYTSEQFDIDLRTAYTFNEAEGTAPGVNTGNSKWPSILAGGNNPNNDLIAADPFFNGSVPSVAGISAAFLKGVLSNALNNYQGTGKTVKQVAAEMFTTGNMYYSTCAGTFGASSIPCLPTVPMSALDDMWRAYREMYLSEKQRILQHYAHYVSCNQVPQNRTNYYNGAIGDPNFDPFYSLQKYNFNPFFMIWNGSSVYNAIIGITILNNPGFWPQYAATPAYTGISNFFHPNTGIGYFDYGSPSSFYHRARYANKIKRVPDSKTLSNSLAGGATSNDDIAANLQATAEMNTYFQTGQCPGFKKLEFFLNDLATRNLLAPNPNPMNIQLAFIPSFTKELYDGIIACSGLPPSTWIPLGLEIMPTGPSSFKFRFHDITAGPVVLPGSDIDLSFNMAGPIGTWNNIKKFLNIQATGSSGGTTSFNIAAYYEITPQNTGTDQMTGATCLQNSCQSLVDAMNDGQCTLTKQAYEVQSFLSAVVADNLSMATPGNWVDLSDVVNYNSPNYFTSLVRFPFTSASVGSSPVTHSVRVNATTNTTIELKGLDGTSNNVTVEFVFTPVSTSGNQDLSGAMALGSIQPALNNPNYDFIIEAIYTNYATQKFQVKINYYGCNNTSGTCLNYNLKNCGPFVPLSCKNNERYKTKVQMESLLTELFQNASNTQTSLSYLANYSNLLQAQIGQNATDFAVNINSASGPGSTYNHTIEIAFIDVNATPDNTLCVVTLTLNNTQTAAQLNLSNWTASDIVPVAMGSSQFIFTVQDATYSYQVFGDAPCLKMEVCETCVSRKVHNEDFESYSSSTTPAQMNFTTEFYNEANMVSPAPGVYGFTSYSPYTGYNDNIYWGVLNPPMDMGTYSIQDNTVQAISGDHTAGNTTTKFLTCNLNDAFCYNAGNANYPNADYVIPWQTNGYLTTVQGAKYNFSIYFKPYYGGTSIYKIQLIANDGTTDYIVATKNIDNSPWLASPNPWVTYKWYNLAGSYFATGTSTQFKIKITATQISAVAWVCPAAGNILTMEGNIFLDDISIQEQICGKQEITPITYTDTPNDDCTDQLMNLALSNAKRKYDLQISDVKNDFVNRYTKKCYETAERLTATYNTSEGHYTLYYYDQAGNLIKTVPPEGVEEIKLASTDPATGLTYGTMIDNDRKNKTHYVLTNHRMATRYEYNSLNQLIRQQMPDHANNDLFGNTPLSSLPNVSVKAMDFSNNNQGYLIGTKSGNQVLYVTNDAGLTWNEASLLSNANIIDVDYNSTGEAVAILSDGSLLKSSNYSGGSPTWQVYTIPGGNSMQFTDIEFATGTVYGIITGKNGLALFTNDGGATWTTINLGTTNDINRVDLKSNGSNWYGVMVGNNGTVYYTPITNPGFFFSWNPYTTVNSNIDLLNCSIIYAGAGMNIIASGVDKNLTPNRGTVLNITYVNGGGTSAITNLYLNSNSTVSSKVEALATNKYTSGSPYIDVYYGGVENTTTPTRILGKLQSISGGAYNPVSLSVGSSPATEGVKDVIMNDYGSSSSLVFGVTSNAKFFSISGTAVTPADISIGGNPATIPCNRVAMFPSSTTAGLITGNVGNMFAFSSSGAAFTSQSNISLPVMNAINAAKDGSGNVFIACNSGAVVFSNNSGSTWQQTSIGGQSGTNLFAVKYILSTPAKVVFAGNNSYISEVPVGAINTGVISANAVTPVLASRTYYTITTPVTGTSPIFVGGGKNTGEAIIDSYTNISNRANKFDGTSTGKKTIRKMDFTAGGIAYAVGDNGTIVKYNIGTNVFTGQPAPNSNNLSDVVVVDQNTAYAFGNASTIFKTTDGANWNSLTSPSSNITAVYNFGNGNILGGGSGTTNLFKIFDQSGDYATRFFYDALGRLIISQNAKQYNKTPKAYSYTIFDALGRITEVGEIAGASLADPMTLTNSINGVISISSYNSWLAGTVTKKEVTKTVYDLASSAPCSFTQDNLRKRVSATYLYNDLASAYNHATYYSYDIHGNVKSLLQENPSMPSGHTCKRIDYAYDLISGNVNKVSYQAGATDAFYHKYDYDSDNRITVVYTSKDGVDWTRDAKYLYYLHGSLARTEIGQDKVQGIDYAYTLQGWIKGVNSVALNRSNDIGKDGLAGTSYNSATADLNKYITNDVAAYALNYFTYNSGANADFKAIDAAKNTSSLRFDGDVTAQGHFTSTNALFNGNIMAMATTLYNGIPISSSAMQQLTTYRYDQLNRLLKMTTSASYASNAWTGSSSTNAFYNQFTYDANGNIQTQQKKDNAGTVVDNMTYRYLLDQNGKKVSNRLYHVNDAVSSGVSSTDIDDQGTYGSVANNYDYDQIGNLIKDTQEDINTIDWTVYGKIKSISRNGNVKQNLIFDYDAAGNRISKSAYITPNAGNSAKWLTTYYVRDAQGNVMATYDYKQNPSTQTGSREISLIEEPIYGSGRMGLRNYSTWDNLNATTSPYITSANDYQINPKSGNSSYELSNHLGNVISVVSDRKLPVQKGSTGQVDFYTADLLSSTDYYAFGAPMPGRQYNNGSYRYGFNGKEQDNEIKGVNNSIDFGDRMFDTRLGIWLAIDSKYSKYPEFSPYVFAANSPIFILDADGNDIYPYHITNLDGTGQAVYKKGEVSAKTEAVIKNMLKTPEGMQFLSQFAKKGQTIAGYTFKEDGKLSNHDLSIYDYSMEDYDGNMPATAEGSFGSEYNSSKNNINFKLSIVSLGQSEEDIAETYTHETKLHGSSVVQKQTDAFKSGGKQGFDKAKEAEKKSGNGNGEKDHQDLKNQNKNSPAYKSYSKQRDEVIKVKPGYKKGFDNGAKDAKEKY